MFKHLARWTTRQRHEPSADREDGKSSSPAKHQPQLFAPQPATADFSLASLEQYLSFWKVGDWDALSKIQLAELPAHPDRAQLALLIAVAHEQQGRADQARIFLQASSKWGASKRQMAQLLISGVHNTLGRARLASGNNGTATKHFTLALPIEGSGDQKQLSAEARMAYQRKLLVEKIGVDPAPRISLSPSCATGTDKNSQDKLSDEIRTAIKINSANIVKQIEGYLGIQLYLLHGQIPPSLHGWPISPDFGCYMIQMIESQHFDLIIEFGSGTSTMLIGSALENIKRRSELNEINPYQLAFEHLEKYFKQTNEILAKFNLVNKVNLVHAQLEEQLDGFDGNFYKYYDCNEKLSAVAKSKKFDRILVIVDGPPALTGKHARYPGIPLILKHFPQAELDILLDDYERDDEKEVVEKWITALRKTGRKFQLRKLDFEKGASHLHVDPKDQ